MILPFSEVYGVRFGIGSYSTTEFSLDLLCLILQSLSKEQAEYCVRRMKPYKGLDGRTVNGALDYKEFAQTLFGT